VTVEPGGARVVIAGLGSPYRRDDGVGPRVASLAAASLHELTGGPYGDPLDLLGWWDGADLAVVVDATRSGAAPGTTRVVEIDASRAPYARDAGAPASTHGVGLAGAFRLACAVGRAPRRLVLVGVEGLDFSSGEGLTVEVESAVAGAARRVVEIVEAVIACA
jgi:hydrogenase maturation protease